MRAGESSRRSQVRTTVSRDTFNCSASTAVPTMSIMDYPGIKFHAWNRLLRMAVASRVSD